MEKGFGKFKQRSERLFRQLSGEKTKVYSFEAAGQALASHSRSIHPEQLSHKGTTLCELYHLGAPVPPGFILATDNFLDYVETYDQTPDGDTERLVENAVAASQPISEQLFEQCKQQIHALEKQTGQIFGGRPLERAQPHTVGHSKPNVADSFSRPALPLLVSVRTGASGRGHGAGDSMLNVGMTDATVAALMEVNLGYQKFALDCQRRFLHAYGTLVLRTSELRYLKILRAAVDMGYTDVDGGLSLEGLVHVTGEFRRITKAPEDPYEQLKAVIGAMYEHSVHSPPGSPHTLAAAPGLGLGLGEGGGVTVIVQQMVYGNLNHNSGSGVCFSRHPREPVTEPVDPAALVYGEYLHRSEGREATGDGRASHHPESDMKHFRAIHPDLYAQLKLFFAQAEARHHCPQYVEFTVQDGRLHILDCLDVDLHAHVRDRRFVPYYGLLLDIQRQEEQQEEEKGR